MLFWKIRYQTSFFLFAVVLVWIFVFNLIGPHSRTLPAEVLETGMGLCRQLCSVTQSLVPCLKEDVCIPLSVWCSSCFLTLFMLVASGCSSSGDISLWGPLMSGSGEVQTPGHMPWQNFVCFAPASHIFFSLYQNPRSHRNRHKAEKQYSLTSQSLLVHSEDL